MQRGEFFYRDTRARIPFALVAVLLLVTTAALVGYHETRGTGPIEEDVSLALDRADASIQTEIRAATAEATDRAASEPLTSVANTTYGNAIDEERPFEAYLEWLIYDHTVERFEAANQSVGDVDLSMSLPSVVDNQSFEAALERVSVEPEQSNQASTGMVAVTIENITVTVTRDGRTLTSQTKSVTVTVPTPVIQQHERTEEYQSRLDAGITSSGFSQRFSARVYALGWARGYAQYAGLPVTEVIANRHIEPIANSARFRTQRDVFGDADPRLEDAVRRGWFCMALQDGEALYDGYSPDGADVADDVCEASEWVLGDRQTGELPDVPDTVDLLGETPGMDEDETIGVNETAHLPLRSLVGGTGRQSIDDIIDRTYTIETVIEADVTAGSPIVDANPPAADATVVDRERQHTGVNITDGGSRRVPDDATDYYRVDTLGVDIEFTEHRTWEYATGDRTQRQTTTHEGTLPVTLDIQLAEGETAPDLDITETNDVNVTTTYERGPTGELPSRTIPTDPDGFENYADRERDIAAGVFGGTDEQALGDWLESHWAGVTSAQDIRLPKTATVHLDMDDESRLISTIIDDISAIQSEIASVSHTFERSELIHSGDGSGPVGDLIRTVESKQSDYLEREEPYVNVGQQAVYEARLTYFELLRSDLETVHRAHDEAMGGLDDALDGVGSGLDEALSHLQQGISAESRTEPSFEPPPLTPDLTYEVSGSPTYFVGETLTTDEVPAVGQQTNYSALAMQNENYLKLPYESIINGIIDRVLDVVGLASEDAELTFRIAGDALRAGELSAEAARADDEYASEESLTALNTELRTAIDRALDSFTDRFGRELGATLYDWETDSDEPVPDGATVATAAADTYLDSYERTSIAAIALGNGTATDGFVESVITAYTSSGVDRPGYAENLSRTDWESVIASAVHPAVENATAAERVSVSSTDTIEDLDTQVRVALENVSKDIIRDRMGEYFGDDSFDFSEYEQWVDGVDTPVRVPAGLPLLPIPSLWKATVNVWDVEAAGQYARFEVTANMSAPGRSETTTYVRENTTVDLDIAGETRRLGRVDPIGFEGRSVLVIVVPPGGRGVGDRDDVDPECSETYPFVGEFDTETDHCGLPPES